MSVSYSRLVDTWADSDYHLWIPGQNLIAATSTASFIQNLSVLRQLVYSN